MMRQGPGPTNGSRGTAAKASITCGLRRTGVLQRRSSAYQRRAAIMSSIALSPVAVGDDAALDDRCGQTKIFRKTLSASRRLGRIMTEMERSTVTSALENPAGRT